MRYSSRAMDQQVDSSYSEGQSSVKEKSSAPLRRSCEACRASKGKCCPSKDDVSRCQRCLRDGKHCVFLETKPRPKRVRTSRTRVAEMEQKLDGIFALLSASNLKPAQKNIILPDVTYPAPSGTDRNEPVFTQSGNVQSSTSISTSSPPWLNFDEPQDIIRKGVISYDKAETLLQSFGTHAPNFPFIYLSSSISLDSLRREKPFLLLSILTVTSHANQVLQNILEAELRETLGRKVIFNGEKSLDLLQGLLIYLTWYHQFFTPERQQIYQLSQMVIAMAVDLDISRPGNNFSGNPWIGVLADGPPGSIRAHRHPSELEAMRTFLGCYYLSSCLSAAFRKPNNMKYTDYVDTCCQTLISAMETPSDFLLPYFIRLQRLAEEISIAFDYGGYQELAELDAVRTEMLIKTFQRQLEQFEEIFPSDAWQNNAVRMAFLHLSIYINEVSLHVTRPDTAKSISAAQSSCREWYYAVARNDSLVACIDSAKKYLDAYLKLPKEAIFQNTLMEEIKLVYVVLIIGRFTSGVDSPFLDASYLRETAEFSHYISQLIERFSGIITVNEDGREQIDYLWHFRRMFRHTKEWCEEQIRGGFFTTLASKGLPDCMDFSFMDALETGINAKRAETPELAEDNVATDDQLWTVAMLEAWPTSTLDPRDITMDGYFQ